MIQIDLPTLVKRLNLFSRQALEMAASECMSQQAAEITVSHVLIQMLAMPRSDLRVITRQGDIGMEELRQALTVENYTTARSADSYPAFSPMLVSGLKRAGCWRRLRCSTANCAAACCCWPCCIRRCVIYRLLPPGC